MKTASFIIAMILLTAGPALAEPGKGKALGYQGQGKGLHLGHSAPLPLAAGLPALLLMGGALAVMGVAQARRGRQD